MELKIFFLIVKDLRFFSNEHQSHAEAAVKIFKNNLLFGAGPNTFRKECKKFIVNKNSCTTHPHNSYLQIISETGLLGIFLIFILFCKIFYMKFKIITKKFYNQNLNIIDQSYILITIYFIYLIPFLPSGNFFNNWINFSYYLPFSFYLLSLKK